MKYFMQCTWKKCGKTATVETKCVGDELYYCPYCGQKLKAVSSSVPAVAPTQADTGPVPIEFLHNIEEILHHLDTQIADCESKWTTMRQEILQTRQKVTTSLRISAREKCRVLDAPTDSSEEHYQIAQRYLNLRSGVSSASGHLVRTWSGLLPQLGRDKKKLTARLAASVTRVGLEAAKRRSEKKHEEMRQEMIDVSFDLARAALRENHLEDIENLESLRRHAEQIMSHASFQSILDLFADIGMPRDRSVMGGFVFLEPGKTIDQWFERDPEGPEGTRTEFTVFPAYTAGTKQYVRGTVWALRGD